MITSTFQLYGILFFLSKVAVHVPVFKTPRACLILMIVFEWWDRLIIH